MTERIVTGEEMKRLDMQTIEHGIPSLVLMERAALASVEVLRDEGFDLERVLVICGPGNNGGDGIAVARLLHLAGRRVRVVFVGDPGRCSEETSKQQEIAESYGLRIEAFPDLIRNDSAGEDAVFDEFATADRATTVVDAIFGIGSIRAPEGDFLKAIRYINEKRDAGMKVLSLDIPSGVCANTGSAPGEAVRADATVTFAYKKAGLTRLPGRKLAGRVIVKDIGIYAEGEK